MVLPSQSESDAEGLETTSLFPAVPSPSPAAAMPGKLNIYRLAGSGKWNGS